MVTSIKGEESAQSCQTAKIHVSPEVADLVKIYCVLHRIKMVDFATEVLRRELKDFRHDLEILRKVG